MPREEQVRGSNLFITKSKQHYFFEKSNSGEDLNGIEEEMIGLFACRHGPLTIYFPHKLVSGNRFRALEALCW